MNAIINLKNTLANPFADTFEGSALDFDVMTDGIYLDPFFRESASKDKKAVIKVDEQGVVEDWWVVGKDYPVKSHRQFYGAIEEKMLNHMDPNTIADVQVTTRSARNGRWGLRDYTFPSVQVPIVTSKGHETTISLRIVAWAGLDGMTANNYMLGALDGFCTNGMVFTPAADKDSAHTKMYKRNTKNFNLEGFVTNLQQATEVFYRQAEEYQRMATTTLMSFHGENFIDNLNMSNNKKQGLKTLYINEVVERGNNVFALHSALTNYSSHDNINLFRTRTTKQDVQAETMFKREEEVSNVFSSAKWQQLMVA